MKKATLIEYDPYKNEIDFKISSSVSGPGHELGDSAELRQYLNRRVLFSNCASDIVHIVQTRQNITSDGLEIQFIGPETDFAILERVVEDENRDNPEAGALSCRQIGLYEEASSAIDVIKRAYEEIAAEFEDYLPGGANYKDEGKLIGDTIVQFKRTVSDAVPVCAIGNYSVGKSALLNSLIGDEVLPSKENPSTAKNVEVVSSNRFAVTVELESEQAKGEKKDLCYEIVPGGLVPTGEAESDTQLLEYLDSKVRLSGKTEGQIIHSLLDILNSPAKESEGTLLARIGWNVVIELPFRESLLSGIDGKVVFIDTPGSDNAELDHESHDKALEKLMGSQTNALPLLVTTRDQLVQKDNAEIREMLDNYADNFASPCCVVVLAKCDGLNQSKLEENIPPSIKNWHGKSIVLYTTAVGALGEKKGNDSKWIDDSYHYDFDRWEEQEHGARQVTLPDYNVYPCKERQTLDKGTVRPELYATGIPSLEYEIAYYVRHYSDYKKCARGKADLERAIASVRNLLDSQRHVAAESKRLAKSRQDAERSVLIRKLRSIELPGKQGIAERLFPSFERDLDDYCQDLPQVIDSFYAEASSNSDPSRMDEEINDRLREHCQIELIDKCYERPDGARQRILGELLRQAADFATELRTYVQENDSHLTNAARRELRECLDGESRAPSFQQVDSVLEGLVEAFEKAALVPHEVLKLVRRPDEARRSWVRAKSWWFEQKLRDHQVPLKEPVRGMFFETLLKRPLDQYYDQLEIWAERFKAQIEDELDRGNAVLSGMESEIEKLDGQVNDLSSRLDKIAGVEEELSQVLDKRMVADGLE